MARQMVGDGQDVYRLKVTTLLPDGSKNYVHFYGPYNSIGTARQQQTTYLSRLSVVDAQIQAARIEWSDVL